ncbi:ADP-binding protein [compost metagenome]
MLDINFSQRTEGLLPPPDVDLHLQFSGDARRATLASRTEAGAAWLSRLSYPS